MFARTDTTLLRRLHPDDLDAFMAYRTDPEVARFQSWPAMNALEAQRFLSAMSQVDTPFRAGHWTQIAVAVPGTDALLGDMGLHLSEDGTSAELGVTIARLHQRKGHALTAMTMAIDLARDTDGLDTIICGADSRNTASLRMIEKLGFVWTHREPADGGAVDEMFVLPAP